MENKDKKQSPEVTQETAQAGARVDNPAEKIQAAKNPAPDLSKESWDKSKDDSKKMWSESAGGRAVIRLFSRGVLGAAFFTAGGLLVRKWMYSHIHLPYAPHLDLKAQLLGEGNYKGNPLKFTAKLIDESVSKPIQYVAELFTGDAEWAKKFVSFRPIHNAGYEASGEAFKNIRGRSLGHEAIVVTFDFFCASIGDALGRDIADLIDPNNKHKPWRDDEGHFDPLKMAKAASKAVFKYITYNGGEDWAVAIPYVFFMKGQRHLIGKMSPGFAADFDKNLSGGSVKVNNNGDVTGTFYKEGALDLQSRYTVYNIGTLMYREAYDKLEQAWNGKHVNLYGAPDEKRPDRGILGTLADVGKWAARSVIKGAIYMTPAVPFFWITRSAQFKDRGLVINTEGLDGHDSRGALLCYIDKHGKRRAAQYNTFFTPADGSNPGGPKPGSQNIPAYFAAINPDYKNRTQEVFTRYQEGSTMGQLHPSYKGVKPLEIGGGPIESMASGIGRLSYESSKALDGVAKNFVDPYADIKGSITNRLKSGLGLSERNKGINNSKPMSFRRFTRPTIQAAISYTPYMYAKAEFANLWDDGKMDLATERLIDGATSFNWGEFRAGLGEVGRALTFKSFEDPSREAEANRRRKIDTSAADDAVKVDHDKDKVVKRSPAMAEASEFIEKDLEKMVKKHARPDMKKSTGLSWRERTIKGQDDEHDHEVVNTKHGPQTHSEREEMMRFLQKAKSPTNSVN